MPVLSSKSIAMTAGSWGPCTEMSLEGYRWLQTLRIEARNHVLRCLESINWRAAYACTRHELSGLIARSLRCAAQATGLIGARSCRNMGRVTCEDVLAVRPLARCAS